MEYSIFHYFGLVLTIPVTYDNSASKFKGSFRRAVLDLRVMFKTNFTVAVLH